MNRSLAAFLGRTTLAVLLIADASSAQVNFGEDVRPILEENCYECHGPKQRKGGLRLTNRSDAFEAGDLGVPAIDPGSSGTSFLYEFISSSDPEERMPKDREPLAPAEVELIRRWIDEGAVWPDSEAEARPHWAYVAPTRPRRPVVRNGAWPRNEIDYLVLERLEREGVAPAPEADPATLLRRVYLDLTGLPPSPRETDEFLRDPSPEAYERVVDEILASPRFGEHWAIPWLDLARYADSTGFMSEVELSNWPYRDWVIDAINADLPFDQFTIEQIAGDLLPSAGLSERTATGFHRGAPLNLEAGVHEEDARVTQVVDRVNTTATVWLGSTLACAQCHDHKYDPFSQEEYYRLLAFFNNTAKEAVATAGSGGVYLVASGPSLELPHIPRTKAKAAATAQTLVDEIGAVLKTSLPEAAPLGDGEKQEILSAADRMDTNGSLAAASATLTTRLIERDGPSWWRPWSSWWGPWLDKTKENLRAGQPEWQTLQVASFSSSDDAGYEVLEDGSVLVKGPAADHSTYVLELRTTLPEVTGIRFETFHHPSLPSGGPGRRNPFRPDFILSEIELSTSDGGGIQRVPLEGAHATRFWSGGAPATAIDGRLDTGWAFAGEALKRDQSLVVATREPIENAEERVLRIEIRNEADGGRSIGRFRLQATAADGSIVAMPLGLQQRVRDQDWSALSPDEQAILLTLATRSAIPSAGVALDRARRAWANLPPAPRALVMQEEAARETHVFERGDHRAPGAKVEPGTPAALPGLDSDLPRNRLGLARWLVDPRNPLTARVTVNRWWGELLGRPIVTTPEDFGTRGKRPTHPKLLDWLATDLVEGKWSRKRLMREIVTSATYRQSSVPADLATLEHDPENRLLARNPRRRLPAEAVRDNALTIAGLLSPVRGGPPVNPPQPPGVWRSNGATPARYVPSEGEDAHRRGVYTVWRRTSPYPSFVNFDAGDRTACVVRRSQSNTPLQALTLLNDEVYSEAALAFADRILRERPDASTDDRVDYAFRVALARAPTDDEAAAMKAFLDERARRVGADPAAAEAIVAGGARFQPSGDADRQALAAWFYLARVLLNLDETITRG